VKLFPFLVSEAVRDLRRAGRVGVSAVTLITLSLAAVGVFGLLSSNLGQAASQWRERLRVVVYLKEEPSPQRAEGLLKQIESVGGVQRLRYISKAEALETLRRQLGEQADLVGHLPANPLPASVEVTPNREAATPEGTRLLIQRLRAFPEVEDVQGGAEWVEKLSQWRGLLQSIGLGVGTVLALAAVLTVTTATTLVVHARREEMEIMRLVGATEMTIRLPLVLQGMAQGLLGSSLALGALYAVYRMTRPSLEPLVSLTLGLSQMAFLSGGEAALLIGGGGLLGAFGGLMATGRGAEGRAGAEGRRAA
jgi:cell division transport system permease protein